MDDAQSWGVQNEDSLRKLPPIWTPLILLVLVSLFVRFANLDLYWESGFWSPDTGWRWRHDGLVRFLYSYGTFPALLVAGIALITLVGSWFVSKWKKFRCLSLFTALLLVLGPGIVVNTVSKNLIHRPRPRDTSEFGGERAFRPVGSLGDAKEGRSFPSGHASMGFYWLGFFIYYWKQHRRIAWAFLCLGFAHGILIGLGRMAQGGHWFTDVLWSAGLVYLSGWGLYWLLHGMRLKPNCA